MLNFFKTKAFKVGSFVVALVIAGAITANAMTYMPIKTGGVENVKAIQTLVGVTADGVAGPMTKAAIATWQAANGLVADGAFGPASAAKANGAVSGNFPAGCSSATGFSTTTGMSCATVSSYPAGCASAVGFSSTTGMSCAGTPGTTPGTLTGGAGSFVTTTPPVLSQYNNEDVGEGEKDVIVAGWEVEADDNSDLSITSAKITLNGASNTGSTTASKYMTEVSIMLDGKEVASENISNFSKSSTGVYSKSVSLSNAIVKSGDKAKLTIAVSSAETIDSANLTGDAWTVDLESVRYVDGTGAMLTDSLTITPVSISFGTFASTTDLEMKVALENSNLKSKVVKVDTTNDTDDVELLKFTVEAKGSDITINDLPVLLTVANAADVDAVANSLKLKVGSDEWTETVSSSSTVATVTFDEIDYLVKAGTKATFTVFADVNDIETGTFDEGDTLKAELTSTFVDDVVAEDKNGDPIVNNDATGTALGNAMAFYTTGIKVTQVSSNAKVASAGTSSNDDVGEFTMVYRVEAFGGTVYVADSATATTATSFSTVPSDQVLYTTSVGGTATTAGLSGLVTFTTSNGATTSGITNGIQLEDGETTDITLSVSRTNTSTLLGSGIWQMALKGISWATSDTATQDVYYFNLDDVKTGPVTFN